MTQQDTREVGRQRSEDVPISTIAPRPGAVQQNTAAPTPGPEQVSVRDIAKRSGA